MIDEFVYVVWEKYTQEIVVYVFISYVFESFFDLKIADSIAHFYLLNKHVIYVFFYFFCFSCTM